MASVERPGRPTSPTRFVCRAVVRGAEPQIGAAGSGPPVWQGQGFLPERQCSGPHHFENRTADERAIDDAGEEVVIPRWEDTAGLEIGTKRSRGLASQLCGELIQPRTSRRQSRVDEDISRDRTPEFLCNDLQ